MFSMILFCSARSVSTCAPSHLMATPRWLAAARAPSSTVSQNSPPVLLGITAKVSGSVSLDGADFEEVGGPVAEPVHPVTITARTTHVFTKPDDIRLNIGLAFERETFARTGFKTLSPWERVG
jgi:hypothetical protein